MAKSRLSFKFYPVAQEDLDEIVDYIYEDSPAASSKLLSKVENAVSNLTKFPLLGKPYDETKLPYKGYRYISVDDYLIFYKIENDSIAIYRIIHGARNYKSFM
jgi:toxin ParE1/3/4